MESQLGCLNLRLGCMGMELVIQQDDGLNDICAYGRLGVG